ncbi:MAG TPA: outer membrane protein assembly factor BamB [Steroidobacteraceae bacterium]|nr:outer membrane protein assembly factor BamB [Steroidobacteraceae bacterium]
MKAYRSILPLAALLAMGCSKEKDVEPPAELVKFEPAVSVSRAWSAGTKGGDEVLRLGLRPAVAGERAYVAGHGGDVQALDLASGRAIWRTATELELAGGPGAGEGLVAVGTSDGEVVALDAETGVQRWRVAVGGEVLAAPAVAGGLVIVRTVSGRLLGLRAADGGESWSYEQPVPRLSLRGNGAPVVSGDMILAGFDNGRVIALSLEEGELLWSATVTPAQGRTEIERLVDIDSPVRVLGQDVYVAGFQGRVAMLARDSGQIWWGRELSSHRGLAADDDHLYVTTSDSVVVALRRRDGTEIWRQDQMMRRGLTAPAIAGGALVVADFEGWLHWLDAATGRLLGRAKAGGGRISNTPVEAGELTLVQTDSGEVQAWRAAPPASG